MQRTCADFLVTVGMAETVAAAAATCPAQCGCAEADGAAKVCPASPADFASAVRERFLIELFSTQCRGRGFHWLQPDDLLAAIEGVQRDSDVLYCKENRISHDAA